jgi:hypothetical protein
MSMLPVFLKLNGRNCLLVGAGTVALDKIGGLLSTGVKLRVIAPQARAEIRELAFEGKLEWVERRFESSDIESNFLVIAATDDAQVNAAIYQGCVERNIPCNSVDDRWSRAAICRLQSQPAARALPLRSVFAARSMRSCHKTLDPGLDSSVSCAAKFSSLILAVKNVSCFCINLRSFPSANPLRARRGSWLARHMPLRRILRLSRRADAASSPLSARDLAIPICLRFRLCV